MPTVLVSVEIVIGTLLVVVLVVLVVLATRFVRRRYIAGGVPLTLCGQRDAPNLQWRLGLVRFGDDALEWYTLGGVSVRPKHRWQRQTLVLDAAEPLEAGDRISLLPQANRVRCTDGEASFELALQRPAYTALRSWQEAAPPGYNVNVA